MYCAYWPYVSFFKSFNFKSSLVMASSMSCLYVCSIDFHDSIKWPYDLFGNVYLLLKKSGLNQTSISVLALLSS